MHHPVIDHLRNACMLTQDLLSAAAALLANGYMLLLIWLTAPAQPVHEQHDTSVASVCMPAERSDCDMQGG